MRENKARRTAPTLLGGPDVSDRMRYTGGGPQSSRLTCWEAFAHRMVAMTAENILILHVSVRRRPIGLGRRAAFPASARDASGNPSPVRIRWLILPNDHESIVR